MKRLYLFIVDNKDIDKAGYLDLKDRQGKSLSSLMDISKKMYNFEYEDFINILDSNINKLGI